MRVVKLSKRDLKDCEQLLKKTGLIEGNRAYPSLLYISDFDMKILEKNVRKAFLKKYPRLSKTKLDYAVGMEMLNLAPNSTLSKAIKPGYALVHEA